ncbi:MAG: peptidylprolyl isomerase, partial [Anaerotignum sp.]|nr:peptidylprolyl isomerase [Anaerotignum sp.]
IFGQVFEGMEVVDAIAAAETDESDKPVQDITIESITFETYAAQ